MKAKHLLHLVTQTDIEGTQKILFYLIIKNRAVSNFYFANYAKIIVSDSNATWVQTTKTTNGSTGLLNNVNEAFFQVVHILVAVHIEIC